MNKYVYSFIGFCIYFIIYDILLTDTYASLSLAFVSLLVSYACISCCNFYEQRRSQVLPEIGISV